MCGGGLVGGSSRSRALTLIPIDEISALEKVQILISSFTAIYAYKGHEMHFRAPAEAYEILGPLIAHLPYSTKFDA